MRILNLQNVVLVSLAVSAMVASSACSSSDAPGRDPGAGASNSNAGSPGAGAATGGSGNTAGATPGAGAGNTPGAGAGGGSAGGATAGAGGAAAPSVCDGVGSRVLEDTALGAFIDDFEMEQTDGPTKPAGGWYGFNDVAPSGTNPIQPVRGAGGATTTMFSGHYSGTGAKTPVAGGYGVGLEINVGIDKTAMIYCVDASVYKGVSFWAKAGGTNKTISAGFVVPSQNQVKNGGDCPDDALPAACNNYPQKNLTLTADWAQYTIAFDAVTGSKGAKVVNGKVQQILWLAPTADWDFYIDEVAFYKDLPAPTGPIAPPAM